MFKRLLYLRPRLLVTFKNILDRVLSSQAKAIALHIKTITMDRANDELMILSLFWIQPSRK